MHPGQSRHFLYHKNLPTSRDAFSTAVAVECMFSWYWIADLCSQIGVKFVLGHALYMKAIHGGKVKALSIIAQKLGRTVYIMLKRQKPFDPNKFFQSQ